MNNIFDWFCRICLIIFVLICINSFVGDLIFKMQYSFPHVSSFSKEQIVTKNNPLQVDLKGDKYIRVYGEKNKYILNLMAEYSISGMVITKNSNFWFRDIMRNNFDDICLLDLGIVWGDLASDKKELYKHWKFKSYKTLGQARRLEWREKPPYNNSDIRGNIAHTHIIPANSNVMGGLLKIKKNDIVKLDGYLVDIYTDTNEIVAKTSLSRTDLDSTSRGYGSCEDMYVQQVQIGDNIYR